MELVGRGSFSTVYRKNNTTVLIKSIDPVKECMALGMFPNSRIFPKVKRVWHGEYEMRYYQKVKSLKKALKPEQYELYKQLRRIHLQEWRHGRDIWLEHFKRIEHKGARKHLQEAVEALSNYGTDIVFEISPRNVAVHNGNLILLDCFFFVSKLKEVRDARSAQ